ncbi:MAG TPA: tRNA (adenosine(37)-N6)-threonylcarbamoyltransferase complex dimerization subunit type 1 TsaB [Methylophilus sp.]
MTFLLLATAFDCCQVALWRDDTLISDISLVGEARHDVALAPLVANLLKDQNLSVKDLSGIAVVTGPGRFTSLRVGISFARALVLPYRTTLYGIPTGLVLQDYIRAEHAGWQNPAWLVAVKRGEIFVQNAAMPQPVAIPLEELAGWLQTYNIDGVVAIGAGITPEWQDQIPSGLCPVYLQELPLHHLGQAAGMVAVTQPAEQMVVRPFYGTSTGVAA